MRKKIMEFENTLHEKQTFAVKILEDHVEIIAFLPFDVKRVDVPDEIEGLPVTVIGDSCFSNCQGITELYLPDSVTEIGPWAFRDCRRLKKVALPAGVRRLPRGAFSFCYLQDPEIVLPEGLEVIEEGAFWHGGKFELVIPDSVKEIGVGAFHRGPHPVTKLLYNRGWFSEWPYGATVVTGDGRRYRIEEVRPLEEGCKLHVVRVKSKKGIIFYPCDYLNGNVRFADEKNRERLAFEMENYWERKGRLSNAYKLHAAWKRGLVEY